MNSTAGLDLLRQANPVPEAAVPTPERAALDAVRDGVLLAPRPGPRRPRRRGRRAAVIAAVGAAAIGGTSVAYHALREPVVADDVQCVDGVHPDVGGPVLSGDLIADCTTYRREAGLPPIPDPVAIQRTDPELTKTRYVVPRTQVPADARVIADATQRRDELAVTELRQSLEDLVDGGQSRCLDGPRAAALARAELARLDLSGWRVNVMEIPDPRDRTGGCSHFMVQLPTRTVLVRPLIEAAHDASAAWVRAHPDDPTARVIRTAREDITTRCVAVQDAKRVLEDAVGTNHHWPVTAVVDSRAACTRVDVVVAGSTLIVVRGPERTR